MTPGAEQKVPVVHVLSAALADVRPVISQFPTQADFLGAAETVLSKLYKAGYAVLEVDK